MKSRLALLLLLGLLLLAGLFLLLRPAPPPAAAVITAVAPPPSAPALRRFDWQLQGGHLSSGPAVLAVNQGERVQLSIRSDRVAELHLHGYDLQADLQPGEPLLLDFIADRSGRFELELHGTHHDALGALEVQPRP